MKKILLMCSLLVFSVASIVAQRTISGKVVDTDGMALIGANVVVDGQFEIGTITDFDGMYELEVPADAENLEVSYTGYATQIVPITGNTVNVTLEEGVTLNTAVVTALGITKEEKSLGYSAQSVDGDAINQVAESNVVNSLAGKVSGMQVIGASGATPGGSAKVRLRGVSSLTGGSPLYVVDGVPLQNNNFSGTVDGPDLGNLAGDINPADIADVSVLKGPAAAALYGNRAKDGVIMITTKKGAKGDDLGVSLNTMVMFDNVYVLPSYQNEYAGGYSQDLATYVDPVDGQEYNILNYSADESWGPKLDGRQYRPWWSWFEGEDYGKTIPLSPNPDNVRDFYQTGITNSNNVSFGRSLDAGDFRVSYTNFNQKGVVPNSSFQRNNVNLSGGLNVTDRFSVKASVNVMSNSGIGRPSFGYSPVYGSATQQFNQWFQRQIDIDRLRDYKNADGTFRSWNIKSPSDTDPLYWDSPFFTSYENYPTDSRDRYFGNIGAAFKVTDNISLHGSVGRDDYTQRVEYRIAPGGLEEEYYAERATTGREDNYELRGTYDDYFGKLNVTVNVGGNIRKNDYHSNIVETSGGLSADVFNPELSVSRPGLTRYISEKQVNSVFGSIDFGYNSMLYLTVTGRNDWSSTLPAENNSYFYPSAALSFVFSELIDNDVLSFGKLRASYASVGSDLDPYQLLTAYGINSSRGANSAFEVNDQLVNPDLKPTLTNSIELGVDLKFFRNRLGLDATYYNNNSTDEILVLQVPGSTGYSEVIVNAGSIVGKGIEIGLSATPVTNNNFSWDTRVNFAKNTTVVESLAEGIKNYLLAEGIGGQGWGGLTLNAYEGEEWGLLRGNAVQRIDGKEVLNYDSEGGNFSYVTESNQDLGSVLPDFVGGWSNTFNVYGIQIGAHLDFQVGGRFFSVTKMFNNYSGLGAETVGSNDKGNPIRDAVVDKDGNEVTAINANNAGDATGGLRIDGVDAEGNDLSVYVDPSSYYGGLFGLHEKHIYDATYVKLREITAGYQLPSKWFDGKIVKGMTLTLVAKNPLLIYSAVDGIDPSEILPGANPLVFEERGQLPSVRSFGFKLNMNL